MRNSPSPRTSEPHTPPPHPVEVQSSSSSSSASPSSPNVQDDVVHTSIAGPSTPPLDPHPTQNDDDDDDDDGDVDTTTSSLPSSDHPRVLMHQQMLAQAMNQRLREQEYARHEQAERHLMAMLNAALMTHAPTTTIPSPSSPSSFVENAVGASAGDTVGPPANGEDQQHHPAQLLFNQTVEFEMGTTTTTSTTAEPSGSNFHANDAESGRLVLTYRIPFNADPEIISSPPP